MLPEANPAAPPNLSIIHRGALPVPPAVQVDGPTEYALHPDGTLYLSYEGVGAFCIQAHQLEVAPAPEASTMLLARFLIGPVLGLALRMQGRLVLHSNVVQVHQRACLLLGHSGAGKSTLTAAFYHAGYPVLSDDVGVLHWLTDRPWASPGPPQIKLWPPVLHHLGADPTALPVVQPGTAKRLHPIQAVVQAMPVAACFVLSSGPALGHAKLSPTDAFLSLVEHAHMPRSLPITGHQAAHFAQSTHLAQQIPMYAVTRTENFADLPALIAVVTAACLAN